jgi:hypothetical protein
LIVAAVVAAVVVVTGAVAAVVLLDGSEGSVREDRAAKLVPEQALLYVNALADEDAGQWKAGESIARRVPALRRIVRTSLRLLGTGTDPLELQARVRPWIGDEAALALVPEGGRATSLVLLEADDVPGARAFLESVARGPATRYRGADVWVVGGTSAALAGGFVAVGTLPNVRAAVDLAAGAGSAGALAGDPTFDEAVGLLGGGDPLVRAYVPGDGVGRLLAAQRGAVRALAKLIDQPGLAGAAAAATAEAGGLRVRVASVFERGRVRRGRPTNFEATLPEVLPHDTIAYLGGQGTARSLSLLGRLTGGRSPLEALLGRAGRSVGRGGQRALERALRPLSDRESAVVVTPPAADPLVSLVIANTTREEGGDVLVALQPLLDRLLQAPGSAGQVPTFKQDQIGGADALTLGLSPSQELTYVAFGGRLIISSGNAREVRRLVEPGESLESNPAFAPGMRDLLPKASSVVFLDLPRLSALAERAGLSNAPELRSLGPDLRKIGAVSGVTQDQPTSQTAEFFAEVP